MSAPSARLLSRSTRPLLQAGRVRTAIPLTSQETRFLQPALAVLSTTNKHTIEFSTTSTPRFTKETDTPETSTPAGNKPNDNALTILFKLEAIKLSI